MCWPNVKTQYDIPDSVLYEFSQRAKESPTAGVFSTLTEIEQKNLDASVRSTINRNQTTQINFSGFVITISTANVDLDGQTTLNVGYIMPQSEMPQSLQTKLYPAQLLTITSSAETENIKLFYIFLIASDPSTKSALIEVKLMKDFKGVLTQKHGS